MTIVAYIEPKNPPLRIECKTMNELMQTLSLHLYNRKQIHICHENGLYIASVFGVKQ